MQIPFNVKIDEELLKEVKAQAALEGKKLYKVGEEALRMWLKERKEREKGKE